MSTFANSFWSTDYAAGLGVLFAKLQQGVQENEQILTVARLRAEAEDLYGQKLGDIEAATNKIDGGFQRDDGASVKKAYEGVRTEMGEASRNHRKIASNIRELVMNPFSRWCDQHASRVQNSQDDLQGRVKAHDRQADTVRQYRSAYYNKCRRVEDVDEEEKLAFQDPNAVAGTESPKFPTPALPSIKVNEEEDEPEPIDIGDVTYQPEQLKKLFSHALETVPLGELKVPILGTYQNISTGAEITEYIQKNMGGTSIALAERIGQDLIANGFLRLVGNMGSTFANSSKMSYQWRPKVFQIAGVPEKRPKLLGRATTMSTMSDSGSVTSEGQMLGDRVSEYLGGWNNMLNNAHPNETPAEKLRREAREADERYKAAVRKLDGLRCGLEEAIIDHLKFMERCELDRLKAIKSVILDFSGAISNVIPSLQSSVDNMMLFQETVQPLGDLRYLLENYRTGNFSPKVTTYENYYNNVDEMTFGVDIEARARSDHKRVPLIITSVLTFLDSHYPDLEGDEARRSIWTVDVPLAATHHLRNTINTGKSISQELLEKYEVPIVASVLKLYLLELPDSLVSSHVYEIVKTIYTTTSQSASESARISVIQSTLGQLRLANIATLDAIVTHFTRLIDLTSADDTYVTQLTSALAPCLMRPKQETGLTMTEKYNVRLVRDLFAHKDAIFGALKRQSALTHTASGSTRPTRAVSTDESRRREHMEERQRAIAAAQHTHGAHHPSPTAAPGSRTPLHETSHRRERSRGPEGRFPVSTTAATSVTAGTDRKRQSPTTSVSGHRNSLGVPQSPPPTSSTRQHALNTASTPPRTNGTLHRPPPRDREAHEDTPTPPVHTSTRERSATLASSKRGSNPAAPATTATISAPTDLAHANPIPNHYYSASIDTAAGRTSSTSGSRTHSPSISSRSSRTAVTSTTTPSSSRKNTLSGGAPPPITSASISSLHRQSLISAGAGKDSRDSHNRESADSGAYADSTSSVRSSVATEDSSAASTPTTMHSTIPEHHSEDEDLSPTPVKTAVQLQDKPMDFD